MSTLGGVARSLPVSEWVALSTYPQSRRPPAQEEDEWGLLSSFSKLVLVTTLCEAQEIDMNKGWTPLRGHPSAVDRPCKDKRKQGCSQGTEKVQGAGWLVWARAGVKTKVSQHVERSPWLGRAGVCCLLSSLAALTWRECHNQSPNCGRPSPAGPRGQEVEAGCRENDREGRAAGVCGQGQAQEAGLRAQREEGEGERCRKRCLRYEEWQECGEFKGLWSEDSAFWFF